MTDDAQMPGLVFALASCQYPAAALDRQLASRSLEKLKKWYEASDEQNFMLILAGDLIYADATAGLFDPRRKRPLPVSRANSPPR